MGPVGRVPSNFGDCGDQVYFVPSSFCNRLSYFVGRCWRLRPTVLIQSSLLNLRGEGKKSREVNGWSSNGRRGRDRGGKDYDTIRD